MNKKKILYFTLDHPDYLSDSFLIGLKQIDEIEVYEYPNNRFIYKINQEEANQKEIQNLYGRGFTLYSILNPEKQKPTYFDQFAQNDFDLYIFSSIKHQFGLYIQFRPFLNFQNTLILDGSDSPSLFPYYGYFWRRPYYWFLPRVHKKFLYYKREWTWDTIYYRWYKLIPRIFCKYLPSPKNLRTISFSIPEEKIVKSIPHKMKLFPKHIVDIEICQHIDGSMTSYGFSDEGEYYKDLQESQYGITTKRAGWDCLRHYEIAANGAVICFKDLDKKPLTCAPHGLIHGVNCLSYQTYEDLLTQINTLSEVDYNNLQVESLNWAYANTCKKQAMKLLNNN